MGTPASLLCRPPASTGRRRPDHSSDLLAGGQDARHTGDRAALAYFFAPALSNQPKLPVACDTRLRWHRRRAGSWLPGGAWRSCVRIGTTRPASPSPADLREATFTWRSFKLRRLLM